METLKFLLTSTFFPPFHIGGDAVHVKYVAEELVKKGHEVHVLHSMDASKIKKIASRKPITESGIATYAITTPLNMSAYEAYLLGSSRVVNKKFNFLVKEIKPDVVHHHNISLLGYSILAKQAPYLNLYTAHDYWLICQMNNLMRKNNMPCNLPSCSSCVLAKKRPIQFWRRRNEFKELVKKLDAIISPSFYMKNRLESVFQANVVVLPNFSPLPPENIGPGKYSNYFIYSGVLEYHKGILNLLNLYRNKTAELPTLIITGSGSLSAKVSSYINDKDLQNKIIFLGHIDQLLLHQLIKYANALIIPSIWPENCPLIALEAISLGTPVISSNQGGLPEIVDKINPSLVYKSQSNLEKIITDFDKRIYDKLYIQEIFNNNFSSQVFFTRYFKLINNFLHNI